MYLCELFNLNKEGLSKLKKAELVDCIVNNGYQYKMAKSEAKEAKEALSFQKNEAAQASIAIASFLGVQLEPTSPYVQMEIKSERLSLTVLVARLMAVADASLAKPIVITEVK